MGTNAGSDDESAQHLLFCYLFFSRLSPTFLMIPRPCRAKALFPKNSAFASHRMAAHNITHFLPLPGFFKAAPDFR